MDQIIPLNHCSSQPACRQVASSRLPLSATHQAGTVTRSGCTALTEPTQHVTERERHERQTHRNPTLKSDSKPQAAMPGEKHHAFRRHRDACMQHKSVTPRRR
mmetsp:Transcript_45987/g.114345  ORF Transcript_45987/g.114345 Transcript_45987/m.114345 type:complete len:103 (-) Transcript_45987:2429-2737(-)